MKNFSVARGLFLAIALAVLAVGCGKGGAPGPMKPAPAVANVGPPPTEEECREFGKKLELAIVSGDLDTARRLYRMEALAERSVADLDVSAAFRKGVLDGVRTGGGVQFADRLIDMVRAGGKFTLLRVRTVDGRPRVLFRVIVAEQGLNYHDLTVARFPDGELGTEDVHIMLTGEQISQTLRRLLLKGAAEQDRGLLTRLSGAEKIYTNNIGKMQALGAAVRQGRPQEAFDIFRQLPAELQKDKAVLLLALTAVQNVSDAEYLKLLESYRQHHPNDPGIDMVSVDYYLLKKQYDEARKCIDRLDEAVGGDAYLLVLRGNVTMEEGRLADAKALIEKAISQEPKLEDAYWSRVSVALKEKNHADTLAWLKKVVEQCQATLDEESIRTSADFAAFARSPQFQELRTWYRSRKK